MFIYETTNLINGKKYIGLCTAKRNTGYLGSGKLLRLAIVKYGKENFERVILEECDSEEELRLAEKRWIENKDAIASPEYYNLHKGGRGGHIIKPKGRMSAPAKEYWNSLDDESRKKRNAANKRGARKRNIRGLKNPMAGRSAIREKNLKWYNDGKKNIYVTEGTEPTGFLRGRLMPRKVHA
jgi:hypothetical protein